MKKINNLTIVLLILIGIIIVAFTNNSFSIFTGKAYDFSCSFNSSTLLSCNMEKNIHSNINQIEDYGRDANISIQINNLVDLQWGFLQTYKTTDSDVRDFFINGATETNCRKSDSQFYYFYPSKDNGLDSIKWQNSKINAMLQRQIVQGSDILSDDDNCGETYYKVNRPTGVYLNGALAIISGTIQNDQDNPTEFKPYKTYGICYLDTGFCDVKANGVGYVVIDSFYIYLNNKVTNENSICLENGIEKCDNETLSLCENYQMIDKGLVNGKCDYNQSCSNCNNEISQSDYSIYLIIGGFLLVVVFLTYIYLKKQ